MVFAYFKHHPSIFTEDLEETTKRSQSGQTELHLKSYKYKAESQPLNSGVQ
jgi:hypothetical protein